MKHCRYYFEFFFDVTFVLIKEKKSYNNNNNNKVFETFAEVADDLTTSIKYYLGLCKRATLIDTLQIVLLLFYIVNVFPYILTFRITLE